MKRNLMAVMRRFGLVPGEKGLEVVVMCEIPDTVIKTRLGIQAGGD